MLRDFRIYFVRKIKRGRSLLVRVSENAEIVETAVADECHELFEIFVGLAGKSGNERRSDRDARNLLANTRDQPLEAFAIAAALHELQDISRSVLQRHVKIFHGLWSLGDRSEKRVRNVSRISVHHADPLETVDLTKCSYECCKRVDLAQVFSV